MTGGVKRRLVAFVILSAIGVTYASANYLGLVDKLLGRGYSVTARLSGTGGLYEGGLVTYRGYEIGKVAAMRPDGRGVAVRLDLDDSAKIPVDSPIYVHNGSAVGEQYLDFEPPDDKGPFLGDGDVIKGNPDTLPVDEGDLLVDLDQFIRSVNKRDLTTVIDELGTMFYNTGRPLQDLIDGGTKFIDEASASQQETIALLEDGRTVLRTQRANAGNIRAFADGMAQLTTTLRTSDQDIRAILEGGPGTIHELQALLKQLQPTLPVFLSNLVTVNQVTAMRLDSVEQLLVTYPVVIASGFSGTSKDGYGHVHLDYTKEPPPCRKGYLPPSRWRRGDDLSDKKPYLAAHCGSPPPYAARGENYVPANRGGSARVAPYDPATGTVFDGDHELVVGGLGPGDVYGGEAWKWMLVGPTVER